MHLHPEHAEKHFTASDTVRDVVVGMSDGLTVPFALAAGISGAIAISHLVVTAGLAEIAAGSIAMGLGGYLAGRSEADHYASERAREEAEVKSVPDVESREVEQVFEAYGITPDESGPLVQGLRRRGHGDGRRARNLSCARRQAAWGFAAGWIISGAFLG